MLALPGLPRTPAGSSNTGRSPAQECKDSEPECKNTAAKRASGYPPQHSY